MTRCTAICLILLPTIVVPVQGASLGWRGDATGCYPTANPPTQWNADEGRNILWKTKTGKGHSTPISAAGRVFVTAEPDQLVCLDRKTGKLLWSKGNGYDILPPGTKTPDKKPPTSPHCGYSSPTPVSDGKLIYASFGTGVVACYDLEGNRRRVRWLDLPQTTQYGRSASPVLADGKLLVSIGGLESLDPKTGEVLWQAAGVKAAHGTPAVAKIGATTVVFTNNGDCVRASDGRVLAKKLARATYTSPLVHAGVVYFLDSEVVAVKLPEKIEGDAIQRVVLWKNDDLDGEMFASPVCHEGLLYCVSNEGTLYVIDATTGKLVSQQEPKLRAAGGKPGAEPASIYPSLTLAGKRLLLGNDAGEMLVLEPGKDPQQVAKNLLDAGSGASPVPDGALLLLRGGDAVYGIGAKGS